MYGSVRARVAHAAIAGVAEIVPPSVRLCPPPPNHPLEEQCVLRAFISFQEILQKPMAKHQF